MSKSNLSQSDLSFKSSTEPVLIDRPRTFQYTADGQIDFTDLFPIEHEKFPSFEFENVSIEVYTSLCNFIHQYWYISLIVGAVYLILAFSLQHLMRHREPIKLKWSFFIWNMLIGVFSMAGFCRTAPPLIYRLSLPDGFYRSLCLISPTGAGEAFWGLLFGLSKYPELLDTLFVVLRKKPLEAAQWFHHVITVIGVTLSLPLGEPFSWYLIALNYGVHSLMYPYFALRVVGVPLPAFIPKIITTCQLAQMLIGFALNVISAGYYLTGYRYCHRHPYTLIFTVVVNVIFIVIFGNVFKRVFARSSDKKKDI